jgi:3-hydroxyacyl-[acyl-carrier-protein] dehydratase
MLMNKLYTVQSTQKDEAGMIRATVRLNAGHPVFEGHFPGNPILPGVCTVQIVKELLEMAFKKELMLEKAGNIKYLGFVSPVSTPEVLFDLVINENETGGMVCSASVSAGGNVVCSFKGEYIAE